MTARSHTRSRNNDAKRARRRTAARGRPVKLRGKGGTKLSDAIFRPPGQRPGDQPQ